MAHRRALDYVLGRHYCPACGKAAGFRRVFTHDKGKTRWYQLTPVQIFCNACGAQVRGHLDKGVWVALVIWGAFVISAAYIYEALKERAVISGNSVQALALLLVVFFSGACLLQVFLSYKIDNHAP